jgi:hypothetical protein
VSTLNVPTTQGTSGTTNQFVVVNANTIRYEGVLYENVTQITYPDGAVKTCADLLAEAGGASYSDSELKACVKVEAIDPDANGRQLFSVYSSNSKQTGKNQSSVVPGGAWVEVFDFKGDATTNPVLALWQKYFTALGVDYRSQYNAAWLGFKINYGTMERRAYVMTQLNDFLEESIPCGPVQVDVTIMHDPVLQGLFQAPAPITAGGAQVQYAPIRVFKLYRSIVTSSGQVAYLRVPLDPIGIQNGLNAPPQVFGATFPHSVYVGYPALPWQYVFGFQFTDTALAASLLEALPSIDWDAPPPRTLKGLVALRNGILAAYDGNKVYFCEPYRPFTFPQKYIRVLPFDVLGLKADGNALVAVTERDPFVFNGSHPANMVYERLDGVQAGLRPALVNGWLNPTRALTRTPQGVIYASKEGLILISGGRARPLFRAVFTRDEWLTRYGALLDTLHLAYADGRLLGYFDGSSTPGFVLDLTAEDGLMTEYAPATAPVADVTLQFSDSLYLVTGGAGGLISRFLDETQSRLACTYWTREVVIPQPGNMGALQLAGAGTVTATVYADGVQVGQPLTFVLTGPNQVTQRLPAGFKARRWSVKFALAADAYVSEAYLATTRVELMRV